MKLNLLDFEENLIARKEGIRIGFSWADDSGKGPEDCRVETGDTVRLRAKSGIDGVYLMDGEFLVRVESVDGDIIQGRLVMCDGVHDNALVRFSDKYVITCSKR